MQRPARRLRFLKRAGARIRNVAQGEVVSGTAYGTKVIGMLPSTLHKLRQTIVIALPDRAKSASITLQYLSSNRPKLDPTFGAVSAPVLFWTHLAFGGDQEDHQCMQKPWRTQAPLLGRSARPWTQVAGPAGSTTMALRFIGWIASSAFHWGLPDGTVLDVRTAAPSTVIKLLESAIEQALWTAWAKAPSAKNEHFQRDPGEYWMQDARRLCKGFRHDWSGL